MIHLSAGRGRAARPRKRGGAMIEFAICFGVLFPVFIGGFQFGYTFYLYNEMETAVRGGARYASMRTYDSPTSTPSSGFSTAVRNMVVYGAPAGGTSPLVPGLSRENVQLTVVFDLGMPREVRVSIVNFDLDAVVATLRIHDKPKATFPYLGRYAGTS